MIIEKRVLDRAKIEKNDEFYTKLVDIENELSNYNNYFNNKIVYCNADNPTRSNFVKYFVTNFKRLGLKKFISTCYGDSVDNTKALIFEYDGSYNPDLENMEYKQLIGNGDFRSNECLELLKQSDIVITNPPFSLFAEYIQQIIDNDKKCIIMGTQNKITVKVIYKLIEDGKLWLGNTNGAISFHTPHYEDSFILKSKDGLRKVQGICWFTNLNFKNEKPFIQLTKEYNSKDYIKYDNCNAINVDKVKSIPKNYKELVGVPISFMHKWNPNQFEIIRIRKGSDGKDLKINGVCPFVRILIKSKEV